MNSIEDGKLGLRNETEQRGRVESTLTSLHQRITDLEKGRLEEIIEGKIMKYTKGEKGCRNYQPLQETLKGVRATAKEKLSLVLEL